MKMGLPFFLAGMKTPASVIFKKERISGRKQERIEHR
jgi:hypothetical protein